MTTQAKAFALRNYRLWVNDERTVLVRMWEDGSVEVSLRDPPESGEWPDVSVWGPPVQMTEEKVS